MRAPPSVWRGGTGSGCHPSAQGEHFEGCLDLKGKEELMLRTLTSINVIGKETDLSGSPHLLHTATYSTNAI